MAAGKKGPRRGPSGPKRGIAGKSGTNRTTPTGGAGSSGTSHNAQLMPGHSSIGKC
jgi:hypothetical protein